MKAYLRNHPKIAEEIELKIRENHAALSDKLSDLQATNSSNTETGEVVGY